MYGTVLLGGLDDDLGAAVERLGTDGLYPVLTLLALWFGGKVIASVWKALNDRLEGWMEGRLDEPANIALATGFLLPLVFFVVAGLWWAAGVAAVTAFGCGVLYPRVKATRGSIAFAFGVQVVACGVAYAGNVYYVEHEASQYDVAFLLAPVGRPEEHSREIYGAMQEALRKAFRGVQRVRVAPDREWTEDIRMYALDDWRPLLDYRTREGGHVRVAIYNRFTVMPLLSSNGAAGVQKHVRMIVRPHLRDPHSNRVVEFGGWKADPFGAVDGELDGIALQASFKLIAFLLERQVIRIAPEERTQIWANLLREYHEFLELHKEGNEKLFAEVYQAAVASPQITAEALGGFLARYKTPFPDSASAAASDRELHTFGLRYGQSD